MPKFTRHTFWTIAFVSAAASSRGEVIQFQRDIRPILSDSCFQCHGADEANRQAELQLDQREGLFAKRDRHTIVLPGQPHASELIRRITSQDADVRMPPPDSDRQLTAREIDLLQTWIAQGAEWKDHWSFVVPQGSAPPEPQSLGDGRVNPNWPRNPIDLFVLRKLIPFC